MNDSSLETWQISDNSPRAYEEYLVPGLFKPWAEKLIQMTSPKPDNDILDVACGTGIVARRACSIMGNGAQVTGLDINQEMLKTATELSETEDLKIDWQRGEAENLPFKDNRFDNLYCQQAMQFFPDPQKALNEMYRVLKPGGVLGLNILRSIDFNPAYIILADTLEKHAGEDAGKMMRSPFPSWNRNTLRAKLHDARFEENHIHLEIIAMRYPSPEEFLRREAASSPLATEIESLKTDTREELVNDLNELLEIYTDDQGIVFPMETYMIIAHK